MSDNFCSKTEAGVPISFLHLSSDWRGSRLSHKTLDDLHREAASYGTNGVIYSCRRSSPENVCSSHRHDCDISLGCKINERFRVIMLIPYSVED